METVNEKNVFKELAYVMNELANNKVFYDCEMDEEASDDEENWCVDVRTYMIHDSDWSVSLVDTYKNNGLLNVNCSNFDKVMTDCTGKEAVEFLKNNAILRYET